MFAIQAKIAHTGTSFAINDLELRKITPIMVENEIFTDQIKNSIDNFKFFPSSFQTKLKKNGNIIFVNRKGTKNWKEQGGMEGDENKK